MNWVHDTVQEFGRQLGLPRMRIDEHSNTVALGMNDGAMLSVEWLREGAGEVLVLLGSPIGFDSARVLTRALEAVHWSRGGMPMQLGVRGEGADALVLALARIAEREFTLQTLTSAVEHLGRWSDEVRHG